MGRGARDGDECERLAGWLREHPEVRAAHPGQWLAVALPEGLVGTGASYRDAANVVLERAEADPTLRDRALIFSPRAG